MIKNYSAKRFFGLFLSVLVFGTALGQETDAKAIIKKAYDLMNGRSSASVASMTIVRPGWSRTVSMKTWSMGSDYYMIQITAPPQDKGQVFLKRNNEMWNWMPSINRIIRIPPSMMGQSWMGSDFTNNDLANVNSIVDDYTHRILGSENISGFDCYKIELIPTADAAVVWSKIIAWVSKKEYYMLQAEYFDEDGRLVNRETQSDIKHLGDRNLPSKLTMVPVNEKGKKTVLEFQSISFNISIDPSFFSQQNMKTLH